MKLTFVLCMACLAFLSPAVAQTKITRYCVVIARPGAVVTSKLKVILRPFNHPELFNVKDSTILTQLKSVNDLDSEPDVLNYMASIDWTFVNVIGAAGGWQTFFFKREFDPLEFKQ
jgi:hypothetical protein